MAVDIHPANTPSAWMHKGVASFRGLFDKGADFLVKGARKQKTLLRLREFNAERLKNVPGYVVLDAARKHVRLGLEAVLVLSVTANLVQGCQMISLSEKLSQKRIALVPARLDTITEVDVGRISERQVYATLQMYLSLLATVDASSIEENYRILKDYMTPELRVQFERETIDYRRMVKQEGLSEQMFPGPKKVVIGEDGTILADARIRVRPSIGSSIGKMRDEAVQVRLKVITNYEKNQWLLQIVELSRRPLDDVSGK